jgi:hypothetical protein
VTPESAGRSIVPADLFGAVPAAVSVDAAAGLHQLNYLTIMFRRILLILCAGLVVSAVAQFLLPLGERDAALQVGDIVPVEVMPTPAPKGCWVAFIVDPDCNACRGLVEGAESDSSVFWLVVGRTLSADSLFTPGLVNPERVARWTGPDRAMRRPSQLGVFAVPTRIVVRDSLIVDLQISHVVPDALETIGKCQEG